MTADCIAFRLPPKFTLRHVSLFSCVESTTLTLVNFSVDFGSNGVAAGLLQMPLHTWRGISMCNLGTAMTIQQACVFFFPDGSGDCEGIGWRIGTGSGFKIFFENDVGMLLSGLRPSWTAAYGYGATPQAPSFEMSDLLLKGVDIASLRNESRATQELLSRLATPQKQSE